MPNTIDVSKLCMGCMSTLENPKNPCPKCGYHIAKNAPAPHHLKPFTILNGKYLVGRVLGEGGFGITYLGWDLNLDIKIAIKEYYPTGLVTREMTSTVTPFSGNKADFYRAGLDKFVKEAKSLAKFYTLPGIVVVKDFFRENGTAYIAMEFINGITLKQHLANSGGRLRPNEVFELMRPLMKSLSQIHAEGIIHRDISPDNIMLTNKGEVKLLDFGAARDFVTDSNKSLSVLLKPGYAPEEQYRTKGDQGPWTDVYALCATIYKMLTGITPPESLERFSEDELIPPSRLGIELSPQTENALLKGLAVFKKYRYQSIDALYNDIYGATQGGKTGPLYTEVQIEQEVNRNKASAAIERAVKTVSEGSSGDIRPDNVSSGGDKKAKGRKKFSSVAITISCVALVLIVVVVSSLLSRKDIAKIPKGDTQNPSTVKEPDPVKAGGDVPTSQVPQSETSQGKYSDKDISFEYPKDWTMSTNSASYPSIAAQVDGLDYQLSVLDITNNSIQDINEYILSKMTEKPYPDISCRFWDSRLADYPCVVTGYVYKNGAIDGWASAYCLTNGKKSVLFELKFPDADNPKNDVMVYLKIISTLKIK